MRIYLPYLILLIGLVTACTPESVEQDRLVLGHAGAGVHFVHAPYVPNSRESIRAALEIYGLDGVEVDLQFTADGVPVLYRSKYLEQESTGAGLFYLSSYNQLKDFRYLGMDRPISDQHILSLKEFLEIMRTHPDRSFSLDLKYFDPDLNAPVLVTTLLEHLEGVSRSRFFLECNQHDVLREMAIRDSAVRCIYNTQLEHADLQRIKDLGVIGVVDHMGSLSASKAREIRNSGLLLITYGQKDQVHMNDPVTGLSDVIQVDNPVLAGSH